MKPTILLVNDDGFDAPGIKELYDAVKDEFSVFVVAPATQQSGKSLGFTFDRPLSVKPVDGFDDRRAWKVNGTPADCVKMAKSVLKLEFDLVLSGINHGSNAGRNLLYSGTVGAVMEATNMGTPGIAFSFEHYSRESFHDMKKYIPPLVQYTLANPLPRFTFFNVTFPDHPNSKIAGMTLARQGYNYVTEDPYEKDDGFMLGGQWTCFDEHAESDIALLRKGYITVVPISIRELTDYSVLQSHAEPLKGYTDHLFSNTSPAQ